jgi:hypothetical protein
MLMVIFFAGIGPWPASYAFASEASAIRLRAKTQGIGWFTYGLGTMVFGVVMPYLVSSSLSIVILASANSSTSTIRTLAT